MEEAIKTVVDPGLPNTSTKRILIHMQFKRSPMLSDKSSNRISHFFLLRWLKISLQTLI